MDQETYILVADDDADFVLLLRTAFECAGFNGRFEITTDGRQVIQFLERSIASEVLNSWPCLVLLDLGLPRLPGPAVFKWIRDHPETAELPVVFMTGAEAGNESRFGADDWFIKPFGFSKLVETAEHLCDCWVPSRALLGTEHH